MKQPHCQETHSFSSLPPEFRCPSFLCPDDFFKGHQALKRTISVVVFSEFQAERLSEKRREAWRPGTWLCVHQRQSKCLRDFQPQYSLPVLSNGGKGAPQHRRPLSRHPRNSSAGLIESQILLLQNQKKAFLACVILCTAFLSDLKASHESGRLSVERDACAVQLLVSLRELSW